MVISWCFPPANYKNFPSLSTIAHLFYKQTTTMWLTLSNKWHLARACLRACGYIQDSSPYIGWCLLVPWCFGGKFNWPTSQNAKHTFGDTLPGVANLPPTSSNVRWFSANNTWYLRIYTEFWMR